MSKLTQQEIDGLYKERIQQLETIKDSIGLKFFYVITEKLQTEKKTLEKLLNVAYAKKQDQDQYSFILDPQFFEQKFLTNSYGNSHTR